MKPKRVMISCAGPNQARIAATLAKELNTRGHHPTLLGLDSYHPSPVFSILNNDPHDFILLEGTGSYEDWWYGDEKSRSKFASEASSALVKLLTKLNPEVVCVSTDHDPIEQLILFKARQRQIPSVCIQDGIADITSPNCRELSHELELYDGGADTYCLWSESIVSQLRERDFCAQMFPTGNPRYDQLLPDRTAKAHTPPYLLLFAAQSFSTFGEMSLDREIGLYRRILSFLLERDDIRVLFKLHPRHRDTEIFNSYLNELRGQNVDVIPAEADSLSVLSKVDALVTISSTVSVEAAICKIPTARLTFYLSKSETIKALGEKELFDKLRADDFPSNFNINTGELQHFVENQAGIVDGKASSRVVDVIEKAQCVSINTASIEKVVHPQKASTEELARVLKLSSRNYIILHLAETKIIPGYEQFIFKQFEDAPATGLIVSGFFFEDENDIRISKHLACQNLSFDALRAHPLFPYFVSCIGLKRKLALAAISDSRADNFGEFLLDYTKNKDPSFLRITTNPYFSLPLPRFDLPSVQL